MSTPEERLRAAEQVMASIPPPPPPPRPTPPGQQLCPSARTFADWCDTLVSASITKGDLIALNQAKLQLLDRYILWRVNVQVRHQVFPRPNASHVCIFAVFESAYHRLQEAVLGLDPSPLVYPPSPVPPPPPSPRYTEVNGIVVAEILDEEFEP